MLMTSTKETHFLASKRENVEPDALKEKFNNFRIIDTRISFYPCNTHLLPPKP